MTISKRQWGWYEGMIKKATHLGQLSDIPSYKIGAILVHRKGIISTGFNRKKSHPLQQALNKLREEGRRDRSYLHAEIDCLCGIREVPEGSTLFVGRLDLNGNYGMCRPCGACMEGIGQRGIREIVFTTPDGIALERI